MQPQLLLFVGRFTCDFAGIYTPQALLKYASHSLRHIMLVLDIHVFYTLVWTIYDIHA